ncbi:deoxyguanosinetriphosphate triphosphohydrolase [Rickettsiales bacterium]|nr:deoxyguanosinetriphosphate triphosphohydrolase [Rickettsiales bacterium]
MNISQHSISTSKSLGRVYKENEDLHRTCFMRDRDRIIHSTAFRKLKYKTQVFVYHEGDYYRTRLSHSIEVSQVARSISRIFQANDDLSEAISLAHDLGHTPFGHAGEEALNDKMKNYGGFDHNYQALKILTSLEKRYINFDGLNLTWETLEGILKHNGPISEKKKIPIFILKIVKKFGGKLKKNATFEAQIAAIADDVAYNNNDIDDGMHANLFSIEELEQIKLVKNSLEKIKVEKIDKSNIRIRHELVRLLIKSMIDDLVMNTASNLEKFKPKNNYDVQNIPNNLVCFSDEMKVGESELRNFLKERMYNHPTVKTMTYKAKKIVSELFDLFVSEYQLLPEEWRNFNNKEELHINVADFISGLTDKNAITIHNKFFDLYNF